MDTSPTSPAKLAFATVSALAIDLTLLTIGGDVSGLLRLLLVAVGVFLVAAVAITALVLLAVDRLQMEKPNRGEVKLALGSRRRGGM